MPMSAARRVRAVRIASHPVIADWRSDGTVYVRSRVPLGDYPRKITGRLEFWAQESPDRTFLAQRDATGSWRRISYGETLARVRNIAQALLNRKLSVERPVVILSGNSIAHALLALGAMYAGVMYAPIAPAYSLLAKEYSTLNYLWSTLSPGLVFAAEEHSYGPALRNVARSGTEIVVVNSSSALPTTPFAELENASATSAVDTAHAQVGPETIAKILFTSGSTGHPKGVINTQRMLCSNQEMIRSVMPFLGDEPPVLCDWLPWNHTFGGNHNFGIVLYNGGTLYIDEGSPTPTGFAITARNLREVATTAYFNVPKGYEMLMAQMPGDPVLRQRFYSRLKLLFYAAAGLSQRVWDELQHYAMEVCGEEILMMTGLGATETSPGALFTGPMETSTGRVGLPAPGVELKLVPTRDTLEARLRGPNVTPGFWRDAERTRDSYDEEGFYKLGDGIKLADPEDIHKGLFFDGRLNEDFKLSTGTWVRVGHLRSKFLAHFAGWALDVVITAPEAGFVGALIFPNMKSCRELCFGLAENSTAGEILGDERVRGQFQRLLDQFAEQSTGSSTLVVRAILLEDAPSIEKREITDKGSINQRAVREHRSALVAELYKPACSGRVIELSERKTG